MDLSWQGPHDIGILSVCQTPSHNKYSKRLTSLGDPYRSIRASVTFRCLIYPDVNFFFNILTAGLHCNCFSDTVTHLHKQYSQVSVYSFHISVCLHPSRTGPFNEILIAKTVQKSKRTTSETRFVSTLYFKNRSSHHLNIL
jgi:hypothetical protein